MARIRIVDADFYLTPPIKELDVLTSEFRGTTIPKVPVIRIFGATDDGIKTCLHVHGVFPYIYIPHDGKENPDTMCYKLAHAIDKTLNIALGQAASKAQHVYKINLISGIPFYGYHARDHQFLKISFYNPHLMKKTCAFLENGTILGRVYQPHEAHIPYIQQFMIDYNLHGMSFINISEMHHRQEDGFEPPLERPGNHVLPETVCRMSRCMWECDVRCDFILNVRDVTPNQMTNPGIAAIWADERQRRADLDLPIAIAHCLTQNRLNVEPTQSHLTYISKLQERLQSADRTSLEDTDTNSGNVSVYPAESVSGVSGDSTVLDDSHVAYVDVNDDEDARDFAESEACQKLYTLLRELAEANDKAQTALVEDSILSQSTPNVDPINPDEESEDDEEKQNELNLSMPLQATPVKQQPSNDSDDEFDEWNESFLANIPQVDGAYDLRSSSSGSLCKSTVEKRTSECKECKTRSVVTTTKVKSDNRHKVHDLKLVFIRKDITNKTKTYKTKKVVKSVRNKSTITTENIERIKKYKKKMCTSTIFVATEPKETKIAPTKKSPPTKAHKKSSPDKPQKKSTPNKRQKKSSPAKPLKKPSQPQKNVSPDKTRKKNSPAKPKKKPVSKLPKKAKCTPRKIKSRKLMLSLDFLRRKSRLDSNSNLISKVKISTSPNKLLKKKNLLTEQISKTNKKRKSMKSEAISNVKQRKTVNSTLLPTGVDLSVTENTSTKLRLNDLREPKVILDFLDYSLLKFDTKLLQICNSDNDKQQNCDINSTGTLPNSNAEVQCESNIQESVLLFEIELDKQKSNINDMIQDKRDDSKIKISLLKNGSSATFGNDLKPKCLLKSKDKKRYNLRTSRRLKYYKETSTNLGRRLLDQLVDVKTSTDKQLTIKHETTHNQDVDYVNNPQYEFVDSSLDISVKSEVSADLASFENNTLHYYLKCVNDTANIEEISQEHDEPELVKVDSIVDLSVKSEVSSDVESFETNTMHYDFTCANDDVNNAETSQEHDDHSYESPYIKRNEEIIPSQNININMPNFNEIQIDQTESSAQKPVVKVSILMERLGTNIIPYVDRMANNKCTFNKDIDAILSNNNDNMVSNENLKTEKLDNVIKKVEKKISEKLKTVKKVKYTNPRLPSSQKTKVDVTKMKRMRKRRKVSSKILEQVVHDEIVNYISLECGKRPKFNLVYGKKMPVVPINTQKVNCNQFPNTEWIADLLPERIVILEDKLLANHERYDLSQFPCFANKPPTDEIDFSLERNPPMNQFNSNVEHNSNQNSIEVDADEMHGTLDYSYSIDSSTLNGIEEQTFEDNMLDIDQFLATIGDNSEVEFSTPIMLETTNLVTPVLEVETPEVKSLELNTLEVKTAEVETPQIESPKVETSENMFKPMDQADITYMFDKNNYHSQRTMEKFRYLKRKQDRKVESIMSQISKLIENSNISGKVILEKKSPKPRFYDMTKVVQFSNEVSVREYSPEFPVIKTFYRDFVYDLDSSDLIQWNAGKTSNLTFDHLLWLDGPNDSSDEEEVPQRPKKKASKNILKMTNSPQYKSLPLVHSRPSLSRRSGVHDIPLHQDTISISKKPGAEPLKQENRMVPLSSQPNSITKPICDNDVPTNVKRKLSFREINPSALNTTIVQEKVSCRYTGKLASTAPNIRDISSINIDDTLKNVPTIISSNINSKLSNKNINFDDEIFSDDEPDVLTKAERYDIAASFVPRAGTSTMWSYDQSPKTPLDIDTAISKVSSSSSSDIILSQIKASGEELDTTLTPAYSKDELLNFSLQDITELRKNDDNLDETLTAHCLTQNLSVYESSLKSDCVKTADGFCELVPKYNPPTKEFVQSTMAEFDIPLVRSQAPFYGDPKDVRGSVDVGMRVLYICGKSVKYLPEFHDDTDGLTKAAVRFCETLDPDPKFTSEEIATLKTSFLGNETCLLEPVSKPPSRAEVKQWLKQQKQLINNNTVISGDSIVTTSNDTSASTSQACSTEENTSLNVKPSSPLLKKSRAKFRNRSRKSKLVQKLLNASVGLNNSCQISGPTLNNTHGFKMSLENLQNVRAVHEHQHITVLVMELHIETRGDLKPNPDLDAICAIFFSVFNDVPDTHNVPRELKGVLAINPPQSTKSQGSGLHLNGAGVSCDVTYFDDEVSLIDGFVAFLHKCDPDILVGYEIQMLSWGYLIDRSSVLGVNLHPLLSRIKEPLPGNREKHEDAFGELYITGRIVLDLWRLLKHEIAVQSYTFENVVFHMLHERVPLHSFRDLTNWWGHRFPSHRHKTVDFYLYRVTTMLKLIDQLDLIGRTSELARLFGILFYEVLSRGSQFRVESMMLRLAKPLRYIPVSPSVPQRAKMRAPEFLPLILEPESQLYTDPVIVLDFQSLYPSIIIAYNYCFSTCVGRVEHLGQNGAFEFGATQLKISRGRIQKLLDEDNLNLSPCGVAFVKESVRLGILPRMLHEIIDTRLMVKQSMKMHGQSKTLQRVLHSRQLGLKLIANVTYGYTAANFSGRMPAVEVGDSVVAKGRETLLRAIKLVEASPQWNCRVVYGDTDSLFVLAAGRSRADAFRIGAEIAEAVTNANPSPVRLKLEKVYQPCILQTKKRYVGYMYEGAEQEVPVYDAKGIETVRRDGCPAVAKMLEKCIRILFETKDVSQIKKYVLRQFSKIITARASIQDLTFAKEYRGASGYRPGACVPALELTRKWTVVDKRNEPRSGQRVPYVIVNGPPGLPLIRMVRSPHEVLADPSLKPNALYYITRVIIPPINRCFKLIGADVHQWFNEMPRRQYKYLPTSSPNKAKKSTISQYFTTINCATCERQTRDGVCAVCVDQPQRTSYLLHEKIRTLERSFQNTLTICESCTGRKTEIQCISLDCPVLYRHMRNERDLHQSNFVRELINNLPILQPC